MALGSVNVGNAGQTGDYVLKSEVGKPGGVAALNESGELAVSQLPASVARKTFVIPVPASGWAGSAAPYANEVPVEGMTADTVLCGFQIAPACVENDGAVKAAQTWSSVDTGEGKATFYAESEKPAADFTIIATGVNI